MEAQEARLLCQNMTPMEGTVLVLATMDVPNAIVEDAETTGAARHATAAWSSTAPAPDILCIQGWERANDGGPLRPGRVEPEDTRGKTKERRWGETALSIMGRGHPAGAGQWACQTALESAIRAMPEAARNALCKADDKIEWALMMALRRDWIPTWRAWLQSWASTDALRIVAALGAQRQAIAVPRSGGLWLARLESGPEPVRRARCRAALRWPFWAADWLAGATPKWDRVHTLIETRADERTVMNAIAQAVDAPGRGAQAKALGRGQWPIRMIARGWPHAAHPRDRGRVLQLEHADLPLTGEDWGRIATLIRMTALVGPTQAPLGPEIRWMKARQQASGEHEALSQTMKTAVSAKQWIQWGAGQWQRTMARTRDEEEHAYRNAVDNRERTWWKAVYSALTPRKMIRIATRAQRARQRAEQWMSRTIAETIGDVSWETVPLGGTARCAGSLADCVAWREKTRACLPHWWCNEGMATEICVPHAVMVPGHAGEPNLTLIALTGPTQIPERSHQVWIVTTERHDRAKPTDADTERARVIGEEIRSALDADRERWERTRASRDEAFESCRPVIEWVKATADEIVLRAIMREIPGLRHAIPKPNMRNPR